MIFYSVSVGVAENITKDGGQLMSGRDFPSMLAGKFAEGKLACVGLDTDFARVPQAAWRAGNESDVSVVNTIVAFNVAIVEATKDQVCAYKPNLGFYLAYGSEGLLALERTVWEIRWRAGDVPVILDAKLGDIGNTSRRYLQFLLGLRVDAVTVNPYLGIGDALRPFIESAGLGVLVLCRTSNSGSDEFQDLGMQSGHPLYTHVAYQVAKVWNAHGNCGLVAGATNPRELGVVREIVGNDVPILCPGVGSQGGDLQASVEAGVDERGVGLIINASSSVIYASGGDDFAEAARTATIKLRDDINRYRGV